MCGVVGCLGSCWGGWGRQRNRHDVTYAHTLTQYHRHVTRFTLTRARRGGDSKVRAHKTHMIENANKRTIVQGDTHRCMCAFTLATRTHNIHTLTCGNAEQHRHSTSDGSGTALPPTAHLRAYSVLCTPGTSLPPPDRAPGLAEEMLQDWSCWPLISSQSGAAVQQSFAG